MNPWKRIYLKSEDKESMMNVLESASLIVIDENDNKVIGGDPFKIRIKDIGTLYKTTENESGEFISEPIEGYHVNVFVYPSNYNEFYDKLKTVIVDPEPDTPYVKYAR